MSSVVLVSELSNGCKSKAKPVMRGKDIIRAFTSVGGLGGP